MKYNDYIAKILSSKNGAITTLNNVHYENIHKTIRLFTGVNAKTENSQEYKKAVKDLSDSLDSSKCRLMAVGTKKKRRG